MKTRHLEADQWLNRKEWCLGSGRWQQLSQDRKDRQTTEGSPISSNEFCCFCNCSWCCCCLRNYTKSVKRQCARYCDIYSYENIMEQFISTIQRPLLPEVQSSLFLKDLYTLSSLVQVHYKGKYVSELILNDSVEGWGGGETAIVVRHVKKNRRQQR